MGSPQHALAPQLFPPLSEGPRQIGGQPGETRILGKGAPQKRDGLIVTVLGQPEHERGLAAPRLRHQQQMAAEHVQWQRDRHAMALMLGDADTTAFGHAVRQR